MTTTVNGFRYGEISRKQAGRYAEEGYQQGCFQFRNVMTMYDTGMTRRYPLRTLIACEDEIYTIHSFRLSDTENFILGFGVDKNGNNVIDIFEWDGTTLTLQTQLNANVDKMFQSMTRNGEKETYHNVTLNEEICRNMRFAQYYNRMYICSSKFITTYIELSGTTWSCNLITIVGNDNAKGNIYFLKDGSAGDGTVVFKWNGKYYKDVEHTEEYTGDREKLEPANNSYISSYDDFVASDDLNTTIGTYPSVIAIINDSLYLANTENKPSTIWKSRTIGSSQWIEQLDVNGKPVPYSVQTLHDFTQFQVVATEETKLKDSIEWPKTQETGYYETENALETWYAPTKTDGEYDYKYKLTREQQYWLVNGQYKLWYISQDYIDANQLKFTEGTITSEYEKNDDGTYSNRLIYKHNGVQVYPMDANENYPFPKSNSQASGGTIMPSDYKWFYATTTAEHKEGEAYGVDDTENTNPIHKPLFTYDMTDADKLYETSTTVDLVSTDSCGVRMELNTGADDSVRFITAGCGKIIVGTSTCEKTLPADFNAVSNMYSSHYSDYGSLFIEPIKLGRSFFFFQTGRKIRELYLADGYMEDADVTALNHDIFDHPIVDTVGKNTPDPSLYSVLDNGEIIQITYDRNGGLNSMARWDNSEYFDFKSLANTRRNDKETLFALVKCNQMEDEGKRYICYFMEPTDEEMAADIYYDEIGTGHRGYKSQVETVYAEVYDGSSVFGRFKKAKTMYIRPYHCGRIEIGNDTRQMNITNKKLGDSDFNLNMAGSMEKNFSIKLWSVGNEAMTILAIAWEA